MSPTQPGIDDPSVRRAMCREPIIRTGHRNRRAIAWASGLGVRPRPFLVAVMLAASAAFATPFGYQTNVLVFDLGRYRYLDFLRIGLPMNIITVDHGRARHSGLFPVLSQAAAGGLARTPGG